LSFEVTSLTSGTEDYLQDPALGQLVEFFQQKGLANLKQEDRLEGWYQDWIDYQAKHKLYASLLSLQQYSSLGHRFDLLRLTRFLETFAYFSPSHAYSLHVSFLGLFPILLSDNEPLKKEAVALLENGGLLAFAVSEKTHGSDLFANEFTLTRTGAGSHVAAGSKYYIGNANAAGLISVLAKRVDNGGSKKTPFVFFALRPAEVPGFDGLRKIRTLGVRTAFVGEFAVQGHPVPESDLISCGREAWEAVHGTVNFGKFFLGFGAIGICEHSFVEAMAHMRPRVLYGKSVLGMPHLRATAALAFARLTAMKLYAYRALDYLQAAHAEDRRYLLFNAVQKAKVSTEGVKVMALLSECIGARGAEAETYFEMALREAQLIPGLEGSTHINFGLTAQFIDGYFTDTAVAVVGPISVCLHQTGSGENPYWLAGGDRQPRNVRFAPYLQAFVPLLQVPNVASFQKQVQAFHLVVAGGVLALNPTLDARLTIALGKCFAIIAYAQLIAENCQAVQMAPATVALMFHGLIEDMSVEALLLAGLFPPESPPRALLEGVVRVPETETAELQAVTECLAARYGA
jgi:acyl-CoA dehydrogenase